MSKLDGNIKKQLRKTWLPFFSRFGKLLEVQRQCIPEILRGINVVVCSPTASGKTEAVLAPLVERLLAEDWEGLCILWISPTRALVNDLKARFTPPLKSLGVSFARKTGDRPEFDPSCPASVLITTPESFDSLLSRHPGAFQQIEVIVLDDIHLLDGTYRGDQVRVLLKRLKRLRKKEIHTYALSATIADPVVLGQRYMSDFSVVDVPSTKELEFLLLNANEPFVDDLILEFKRRDVRKVLVFVNSRAEAEALVARFRTPPFLHKTFAHHGSLSKREREEIEGFMNISPTGICIATTTLELGIDIGDIDAVVLYGPPHDVRSLLQRVGRGNRRRQDRALAFGVYNDEWEKLLFEVLFHEAQAGRLESEMYSPHLSVGVQQIFSYLHQRRHVGTTLRSLKSVLSPIVPEESIHPLLNHLMDKEYVETSGDTIFAPSDKLLRLSRRGLIHSNIESRSSEYTVLNADGGGPLGSIQILTPFFRLGGRTWNVVRIQKNTVWVKPAQQGLLYAGRAFKGKNIFWDFRLGLRLKERLHPALAPYEYPFRNAKGALYLFHLSGPIHGFLWQEALRKSKFETHDSEGTFLTVEGVSEPDQLKPDKGQLLQAILDNTKYLKRILPLGAYFHLLSKDLQPQAVGHALNIEAFYEHLTKMKFKEISEDAFNATLALLDYQTVSPAQ
ncbi:MAG: DEAD/DEAH box helicase [Gemmatimonadota bacterium]|nr:MAG: DEAD/DEAH box helicase [Gemmatimonadota bacterium]